MAYNKADDYGCNNGTGESNILQNQFTAYLMKAIKHKKIQYLRKKTMQKQYEVSFEIQDYIYEIELDMFLTLPVIEQLENEELSKSLKKQKERDIYIFFAKILEDRSFVEIAAELDISYKAVTMSYYRVIKKIKND